MFYPIQLLFVIPLTETREIKSNQLSRFKRAQDEKFHILLSLYQMNPLKQSNIYKTFSNRMLITHKADDAVGAMNFDSNESAKDKLNSVKVKLKLIENTIHTNHVTETNVDQAVYYNPFDTKAERFSGEYFRHHKRPKHKSLESAGYDLEKMDAPDFNTILEHIESSENGNDVRFIKGLNTRNVTRDISNAHKILRNNDQFNKMDHFSEDGVIIVK